RRDSLSLTHNLTRSRRTILRRPRAWPAHIRKPQRPGNSVQPPAGQKPRKHALFSLRLALRAVGLFGARASASLASRWTSVYLTTGGFFVRAGGCTRTVMQHLSAGQPKRADKDLSQKTKKNKPPWTQETPTHKNLADNFLCLFFFHGTPARNYLT